MKILSINKRANFDYEILEKQEGGLVLFGQEVKSIKSGQMSIKGAYVTSKGNELFLTNSNIPAYQPLNTPESYDPMRPRKVLLHRREIKSLVGKINQKGLTLVPIKVYSMHGLIKLEFGIGKGKKKIDKREDIKKREDRVRMSRAMRTKK